VRPAVCAGSCGGRRKRSSLPWMRWRSNRLWRAPQARSWCNCERQNVRKTALNWKNS